MSILQHQTDIGDNGIMWASRNGQTEFLLRLRALGVALDTANHMGVSPLMMATRHRHIGTAAAILDL